MAYAKQVLSYDDVQAKLGDGRKHILLGNGFSIACDPIFDYARLYDAAIKAGLSKRAQKVFEKLGTNNFEGVMRLLEDAHWIAQTYHFIEKDTSAMLDDVQIIKQTLIEAVAESHLENTGKVPDFKKDAALNFLKSYHNIFTTNYDLLVYWVGMHAGGNPPWEDGFRSVKDDPHTPCVVFSERIGSKKGLFYLHGALHLHISMGELRKHTWIRTGKPLTQLIREGLAAQQYPIFVTEGTAEGKLEQIQRIGYLWYCLDKLARIETPLVVFGHSLGQSDQHIANAIALNPKLDRLAIGLYGDPKSNTNQEIYNAISKIQAQREDLRKRKQKAKSLEVFFYDSASAKVWDY